MERIDSIMSAMLNTCAYCNAAPLIPCNNDGTNIRYTHTERNR